MTYPSWHKKELVFRPQMHIQHYKERMAHNDLSIAGCGCRGCMWAYRKMIDQRADLLIERQKAAA